MADKWFAVFRTGAHTDSSGEQRRWTADDLDRIIEMSQGKDVPLVIGHPGTNSPAWGWVSDLKRVGDVLLAKPKDMVAEFVEWVNKKMYRNVSISLRPDMTLRHIGFLGAEPPAVKGLPAFSFNEEESVTIEFSDYRINSIGSIMQRIREFIIEKFGTDTADKVVGSWEIEDLKRVPEPEIDKAQENAFNEGGMEEMKKIEELEAELKEAKQKNAEFSEAQKKKDEEYAATLKRNRELEAENRKKDFATFCEGLSSEGRLTPAMQPVVLDFMEILSGAAEYEFSEGEAAVKKQPLEAFKGFLSGLPKVVEFSEVAKKGNATDGINMTDPDVIARDALEYKEAETRAGRSISISQAVNYVIHKGGKNG